MRWLKTEYILKGVFLGLLLFAALQAAVPPEVEAAPPGWPAVAQVIGLTAAGLAVALAVAGVLKVRQGHSPAGRFAAFVVFLVLESPAIIYAGVLLGLLAGVLSLRRGAEDLRLLVSMAAGGAVLGVLFGAIRTVERRETRLALSLLLAAVLAVGALAWMGQLEPHLVRLGIEWSIPSPITADTSVAVLSGMVLLGLPFFYLLAFAGTEEETEIEIGAACAVLALGLYFLTRELPPATQSVAFLVPVMIYFGYTMKVLPGLRVFKHSLRGLSHLQVGRHRSALLSFRRALQLDPVNTLARQGYWRVHCALDLDRLPQDPQTMALVDLDLCLDRAGSNLLDPSPSPERLQEADRLLNLVQSQRPALHAPISYWRAVAATHQGDLDRASHELEQVLDPTQTGGDDPARQGVLFAAWQLALVLHDELRRRVGMPQLALPGRRMEAIAAVERQLAQRPDDTGAWGLKRMLYQDVTVADYEQAAPGAGLPVSSFDHEYVQQLGLAMISDEARWQRGVEYLRLASHGLPALGPTIFVQIAQAHQRAGDGEGAWHNYELAKRAGQAIGPKSLDEADRQAYFETVKMLGEAADRHGRTDLAIENYRLYAESERSGVETLRRLASLYEAAGDVLAALRSTEQALVYNAKDADLLERKDRYYYSVLPQFVRDHPDAVPGGFDTAYCLSKAKTLLAARELDLDSLDWAQHLADLACAVKPDSVLGRVLAARARLRRGERDEAVALLEAVHQNKPTKFLADDEEEAWYLGCRLLGDLYLQELGKPELAVPCYNDYRKSSKSGADTVYKLGQAYEQLGDRPRALKCYEQVTAYEAHPLAPDAREALYRLQQSVASSYSVNDSRNPCMTAQYAVRIDRAVKAAMSDGTLLAADVYRPDVEGQFPAVLERTPYNREQSVILRTGTPQYLAERGIVVVVQDVRGRWGSEGTWYPFVDDGWGVRQDGHDSVAWVAEQPWCNGKVGTIGGSYAGQTQLLLAVTRPDALVCGVVRESASDLSSQWCYRGGAFEWAFNFDWCLRHGLTSLRRQADLLHRTTLDEARFRLRLRDDPPATADVFRWLRDILAHPEAGPFWEPFDLEAQHDFIRTPLYHVAGWFDIFLDGTLRNYQALARLGLSTQRLIVGPWAHGPSLHDPAFARYVGEMDFGPDATIDFNDLHYRWYDHWLNGAANGALDGPPVRYFLMGANEWRTAVAWPPGGTSRQRYYLRGGPSGTAASPNDGRLSTDPPQGDEPADVFSHDPASPVPTLGGATLYSGPRRGGTGEENPDFAATAGPRDQRPVEPLGLTYTSEELTRPLDVIGVVTVTLHVTTDAQDADFVARLTDVFPDGRSILVTDGIQRGRYRKSRRTPKWFKRGRSTCVKIELGSTAWRILPGHRLRLAVAGSNFPRFDLNDAGASTNQVHHDVGRESRLTISVMEVE